MITRRAYEHYRHRISATYLHYGIEPSVIGATIPAYAAIANAELPSIVCNSAASIRTRLSMVSVNFADLVSDQTSIRSLVFDDKEILIPLINQQGREWYGNSPLEGYDFTVERQLGLLDDAKVVYDIGGHHGVWAAYYATLSPAPEVVYSFEPSLINIEVASLLMLVNNICNVCLQAAAVCAKSHDSAEVDRSSLLIDFVDGQFVMSDFLSSAWQRADFIKIDIEGYEYELITRYDWIFSMTNHMHLELHIPHLIARGLDYRAVRDKIPFDKFSVFSCTGETTTEVDQNTELSGFCSLMLKRKQF